MFMSVTVANLLARLCFLGALYVSACCNTRVPPPRGWCAWLGPAQPSYLRAFPPPSLQLLPAAESTAVTPAPNLRFSLRSPSERRGWVLPTTSWFGSHPQLSVIEFQLCAPCRYRDKGISCRCQSQETSQIRVDPPQLWGEGDISVEVFKVLEGQ